MADHTEKRIRREIANSNERRRMQSINTGFNSLRTMLPKHDGEKLSKAAILQHTAEYIDSLEQEKTRLLAQQHQLKRLVTSIINGQADIKDLHEHQVLKKLKIEHGNDNDSSDEGICNASPIEAMDSMDDLKSEMIEVRKTVDRERKLRMQLEETIKTLEQQLHPERVKEITHQVQVKLHHQQYESASMDNSENENDVAVASLVDYDENVIGETIEIETRSCPGSPQQQHQIPTTIVIQGANNTFSSGNPIQLRTAQGQIIKVEPAKRNAAGRVQVKGGNNPAAIALPIEMPYISGSSSTSGGGGDSNSKNNTVTVQILNGNDGQAQASHTQSRHNLETIVEAIRHLEGDHMFKDDSESNVYDEEEVIANEEEVVSAQPQVTSSSATTSAKTTTTAKPVATVSSERMGAIRQKVIKNNNLSNSGGGRPGVIVAKIK